MRTFQTEPMRPSCKAIWALRAAMEFDGGVQRNIRNGIRQTAITRTGAFTGGSGPPPPNLAPYNGSLSTGEWTPSALLSADYEAGDAVLLYGTSSYGAKAGGFNPVVPTTSAGTILSIDTLKVKPERMVDFELGLKSALLDRRVILNVDGYWASVGDYQASAVQTLPNNQRTMSITNVGSVRTAGIEADLTANLLSAIQFTSSLSYNDAHYVAYPDGPPVEGSTARTQDLSGRPLLLSPTWAIFAGLRYSRPFAPGISGFIEAEWTLKSAYYGYPDDSVYVRVPATNIENFQLGLTIDRAGYCPVR